MIKRFKYISFSSVVLITLMVSLLLPTAALADGSTTPPPTDPTQVVVTPDAGGTDVPTDAVATQPAPTDAVPTDVAPTDVVVTEAPVTETVVTTETPAGTTQPADLTDVVASIADANAVVTDANGNPIPLASQQAADVLASTDPYFDDGAGHTVGYSSSGACAAAVTVGYCHTSTTPLQDAINAAPDNATVYVEAGTYNENISITKSITLFGAGTLATQGAGTNAPTIDGGAGTNPATITVNGSSPITVTIRNFNIANGGDGINVLQNAVMTIDNNTISGYYKNGITFGPYSQPGFGGVSGTIRDNVITGAGPVGIGAAAQNGIQISESNTATIDGNIITGNNYTPNTWTATGILLYEAGNGVQVTNNTLGGTGNAVNKTNVSIYASNNVTITNNTISNSTEDNVDFDTVNGVTFTGNTVSNGGYDGVWLATAGNVNLAGNIFTNNANGAAAAGDPHAGAIHLATGANPATITIANNNSFAGDKNGVSNESNLPGFVVATSNWWGCATGPGTAGCDTVYGNVTTAPFLTTDPFATPPQGGGGNGGGQIVVPLAPFAIIPITGGQQVAISCDTPSVTMQVGGVQAVFTDLCGYDVILDAVTKQSLPGNLGSGNNFIAGITITLLKDNKPVTTLPKGASIDISYLKPATGSPAVVSWNGSSWGEVASSNSGGRIALNLTEPGTFVFVTK